MSDTILIGEHGKKYPHRPKQKQKQQKKSRTIETQNGTQIAFHVHFDTDLLRRVVDTVDICFVNLALYLVLIRRRFRLYDVRR